MANEKAAAAGVARPGGCHCWTRCGSAWWSRAATGGTAAGLPWLLCGDHGCLLPVRRELPGGDHAGPPGSTTTEFPGSTAPTPATSGDRGTALRDHRIALIDTCPTSHIGFRELVRSKDPTRPGVSITDSDTGRSRIRYDSAARSGLATRCTRGESATLSSDHPGLLRRWWWKSPLAARLVPASGLVAAVAFTAVGALPDPAPATAPAARHLAPAPAPTSAPVLPPAPSPTTPPPPAPPPETTPSAPRSTTTTTTGEPSSPAPTTTTPRPAPLPPPPPRPQPPEPTTTTTTEEAVPVVTPGKRCERQGDAGRTYEGAAASCQPDDDGDLRWTTQW